MKLEALLKKAGFARIEIECDLSEEEPDIIVKGYFLDERKTPIEIHCFQANINLALSELEFEAKEYLNMATKKSTNQPEEQAKLEGFLRYQKRADIHEEERNMSSQMYEAGWEDGIRYKEKRCKPLDTKLNNLESALGVVILHLSDLEHVGSQEIQHGHENAHLYEMELVALEMAQEHLRLIKISLESVRKVLPEKDEEDHWIWREAL